jgi:hypothetical protein
VVKRRTRRRNPHLVGAQELSDHVLELAYVHGHDGQEYVHKFAKGVTLLLLRDGRLELFRPDGKRLWGDF